MDGGAVTSWFVEKGIIDLAEWAKRRKIKYTRGGSDSKEWLRLRDDRKGKIAARKLLRRYLEIHTRQTKAKVIVQGLRLRSEGGLSSLTLVWPFDFDPGVYF